MTLKEVLPTLVDYRKEHKITQQQVATKMGISKSAISRLEHDRKDHRLSSLLHYASAIGLHITIVLKPGEAEHG